MPEELKPCDFCIEDKSRMPTSVPEVLGVDYETVCVRCRWCGARGPSKSTEAEAIAAWNTRPVSEIERLAREFFDKVTEIGPRIDAIIGVQTARGYPYIGPNWKAEYDALAAYFAEPAQPSRPMEAAGPINPAILRVCRQNLNDKTYQELVSALAVPAPPADTRQKRVLDWAVSTFGTVANNRDERAARLVEESIEIAQAEGVNPDVIERILRRVYSRAPGEVSQEIGGAAITLDALAQNLGIDVGECADRELARVLGKSEAHFEQKHAEKAADGVANLSIQPPADTREPNRCLSKEEWIKRYGGQDLLDSEGLEVVPCIKCEDHICHGWKVQLRPAEPRCFTCDLRLSECECEAPEPYSGSPAEPARTWLLWFDNKDCVDEVFTDYGAARKRYETCSASWSCTLFASVVGRPAEPQKDFRFCSGPCKGTGYFEGSSCPVCNSIGRPAEPVREWRLRNKHGVIYAVSAYSTEVFCREYVRTRPGVTVVYSIDGGKTWQDADTSAAEGKKC